MIEVALDVALDLRAAQRAARFWNQLLGSNEKPSPRQLGFNFPPITACEANQIDAIELVGIVFDL
jgi:hypothetical protein